MRRAGLVLALVAGLIGATAASVAAHIQVSPTSVAPNDAVKFTVLVPGERAPHRTEEVILRVPAGVLPYSFESTPGWRRTTATKNGAAATITWRGRAEPDGFVEFSFLAATPPQPGALSWKAVQVYDDGQVVRWIGGPSSEEPAAQTDVRVDAPLQNAGGEGAAGAAEPLGAAGAGAGRKPVPAAASAGGDEVGRWLAIGALVLAAAALVLALVNRRQGR